MIIDDEADVGALANRKQFPGDALNLVGSAVLRAQLNEIGAAIAELPRDLRRGTAMKVSRIDKGVEMAIGKGLHKVRNYLSPAARTVAKCGGCSSRATTVTSIFLKPAASSQR